MTPSSPAHAAAVAPARSRLILAWELAMLGLLLVNLALLVVELLWAFTPVAALWQWLHSPSHALWGSTVHRHFAWIDSVFVAIFLAEFLAQWSLAVVQRRYPHWYAYPVLHWYDALGCIPVAGFRFLRLLRVVGILLRLQRMGLIRLQNWAVVRFAQRLVHIVVEEVSDRVVIKVLSGVQDEIRSHGILQRELLESVLLPRRERLSKAIAQRVGEAATKLYAHHREPLNQLLRELVHTAVAKNRELNRVELIPMLGDFISKSIEHAIHDITGNVIAEGITRLDQGGAEALVHEILGELLHEDVLSPSNEDDLTRAVIEVLELVKQRVARRSWLEDPASA